jgi:hypothetical protein
MVAYKGGRCSACGYNRSLAALCFHHRIDEPKAFGIAGSHSRSWATLQEELDKCELLCLNCHVEWHAARESFGRQMNRRDELDASAELRKCSNCGRRYAYDFRKGHTRRICNSCRSNRGGGSARRELKLRLAESRGGACQQCGYRRCVNALCFHHTDTTLKRFSFAGSHLRSPEALANELENCILLCHNCHAVLHDAGRARHAA